MGKTKNTGLGLGTTNVPQCGISQSNVETKANILARQSMIDELEKAGVKYKAKDVIFVVHDKTGQMIWLEKGNDGAGLKHILKHASDFESKHGIKKEQLAEHIKVIFTNGKLEYSRITKTKGRDGYERLYSKNGEYYLLCGVGINGFLISAYPIGNNKAQKLIRRYKEWKKK